MFTCGRRPPNQTSSSHRTTRRRGILGINAALWRRRHRRLASRLSPDIFRGIHRCGSFLRAFRIYLELELSGQRPRPYLQPGGFLACPSRADSPALLRLSRARTASVPAFAISAGHHTGGDSQRRRHRSHHAYAAAIVGPAHLQPLEQSRLVSIGRSISLSFLSVSRGLDREEAGEEPGEETARSRPPDHRADLRRNYIGCVRICRIPFASLRLEMGARSGSLRLGPLAGLQSVSPFSRTAPRIRRIPVPSRGANWSKKGMDKRTQGSLDLLRRNDYSAVLARPDSLHGGFGGYL